MWWSLPKWPPLMPSYGGISHSSTSRWDPFPFSNRIWSTNTLPVSDPAVKNPGSLGMHLPCKGAQARLPNKERKGPHRAHVGMDVGTKLPWAFQPSPATSQTQPCQQSQPMPCGAENLPSRALPEFFNYRIVKNNIRLLL